jgi:YVTN family beta-propeller protein
MARFLGPVLAVFAMAVVAGSGAVAAERARAGGTPVALVTAEIRNQLLAVSLSGGEVLRRVHLDDPQTVAAAPSGQAVVVSPKGTVTLLDWRSLRPVAVLRGFRSPQIAAITPDGDWVYVTDAATGELSVIELQTRRVVDRLRVGADAHHLAISPDFQRAWVALGESATTIVVLDTSRANRPRVIGRIRPRVPAHDLAFAPDGRTVWVTSATARYVSILNASTGRLVATVPAGPAPQHIAFGPYVHPRAFITSGYGSTIELVDVARHKVLRRAAVPYGSFNVTTAGGLVVTSSLVNGAVTELTSNLRRRLEVKVAPSARDAAISVW